MTAYARYGESSEICEEVVKIYCEDKYDAMLDPGCFVMASEGTLALPHTPLRFNCDSMDCHGRGFNFGAPNSTITCSNADYPPFQSYESLISQYTLPSFFPSRTLMHRANPICSRIECTDNSREYTGENVFLPIQFDTAAHTPLK